MVQDKMTRFRMQKSGSDTSRFRNYCVFLTLQRTNVSTYKNTAMTNTITKAEQHVQRVQAELVSAMNSFHAVDELTERYAELIDSKYKLKDTSKRAYKSDVKHFLAFIQANGINEDTVAEFRETIAGCKCTVSTKNSWLKAAKALLKEAYRAGILSQDLTLKHKELFKTKRGHKKDGLTKDEMQRVWHYVNNLSGTTGRKLRALTALMASEGLRQFEARQLRLSDVETKSDTPTVTFISKGDDDSEVFPITRKTAKLIQEYIDTDQPTEYLFPSATDPSQPVSLRAIRKYYTCSKFGVFARCDISGKSVHGFRHYYITTLLDIFNGDLAKVRRRSRHKSFDMLIVYDDARTAASDMERLNEFF